MKQILVLMTMLYLISDAMGTISSSLYLSQIAATAAKDLQVTLELLSIAENEQKRLSKIHSDIRSKQMLARRIERRMDYVQSLSDTDINSHRELNMALRRLRYEINESERALKDIEKNYGLSFAATEEAELNQDFSQDMEEEAEELVIRAYSESDPQEAAVNTAINSAFSASMMAKLYSSSERGNESFNRAMTEFYRQQYERRAGKEAFDEWTGANEARGFWARKRGVDLDN